MREFFDSFLCGEPKPRPAVILLGEALSARLGNMSLSDMQGDASFWAANQCKLQQLLNIDGLLIGADNSVLAEAVSEGGELAYSGRLQCSGEALSRLCQTEQGNNACIGMTGGPSQLAGALFDDESRIGDVKGVMTELMEKLCEPRPDLLLLRESGCLGQKPIAMSQRKAYNTIKNLLAYYDVPLGIYLENYRSDQLVDIGKLKVPYLFLGMDVNGNQPEISALVDIVDDFEGLGLPLNFSQTEQALSQSEEYRNALSGANIMFVSGTDLERDTDLEALIALCGKLTS